MRGNDMMMLCIPPTECNGRNVLVGWWGRVGWGVKMDLHSRIRRHCGGDGLFELGREAKKSPGGLRLLKKTCVSGDCVREGDDAAGGVEKAAQHLSELLTRRGQGGIDPKVC